MGKRGPVAAAAVAGEVRGPAIRVRGGMSRAAAPGPAASVTKGVGTMGTPMILGTMGKAPR